MSKFIMRSAPALAGPRYAVVAVKADQTGEDVAWFFQAAAARAYMAARNKPEAETRKRRKV